MWRLDPIICNNKQNGIKINVDVSVRNQLIKNVIKILSVVLVIVNVNIKKAAHLLAAKCEEIIDNKTVSIKNTIKLC